jgi:glutaminyl-peptide cyclotransferase
MISNPSIPNYVAKLRRLGQIWIVPRSLRIVVLLITITSFLHPLTACGGNARPRDTSIPRDKKVEQVGNAQAKDIPFYAYEVVNSWPHDSTAFTQGLVFLDGWLYESTGHYGSSTLRKVELRTGQISKKVMVPEEFFAEGLTILQGKLYQLTWAENKAFVYDLKSLRLDDEFRIEGEGWGLTNDGRSLIISDGTDELRFMDPATHTITRTINVKENGKSLRNINELEYIKGEIYANVWKSDRIARIDPRDGKLLGWIDLTGLLPLIDRPGSEDVLNGIAYDEKTDRLFVTGKRWPKIFEIRLKVKS